MNVSCLRASSLHSPAPHLIFHSSICLPPHLSVGLKESARSSRQQTPKQWKHSAATGAKQGSTADKREYLTGRAPSYHAPLQSTGATHPEIKNNLTCPLLLVSWLLGIPTIGRSQL